MSAQYAAGLRDGAQPIRVVGDDHIDGDADQFFHAPRVVEGSDLHLQIELLNLDNVLGAA